MLGTPELADEHSWDRQQDPPEQATVACPSKASLYQSSCQGGRRRFLFSSTPRRRPPGHLARDGEVGRTFRVGTHSETTYNRHVQARECTVMQSQRRRSTAGVGAPSQSVALCVAPAGPSNLAESARPLLSMPEFFCCKGQAQSAT